MTIRSRLVTIGEEVVLTNFVKESNKIEGILEVRKGEVDALQDFITLEELYVNDVCNLVHAFQPDAHLRNRIGVDVTIGDYTPPPGGPEMERNLKTLLDSMGLYTPYHWHNEYESMHPFMDCNGRSGRALWLWHMMSRDDTDWRLGFLHAFYYQSLQGYRG